MNWRTSTVVQLCEAMRQTQDYTALPILADALQDADYPDAKMLTTMRNGWPDLHDEDAAREKQRLVALIYSDETAEAVKWMEQFIRDINDREIPDGFDWDEPAGQTPYKDLPKSDTDPHTYGDVMRQGESGAKGGPMYFGSDEGAGYFRDGEHNQREFFRNWSLITGVKAENWQEASYSCAC